MYRNRLTGLAAIAVVLGLALPAMAGTVTIFGCSNTRTGRISKIGTTPPVCSQSQTSISWGDQTVFFNAHTQVVPLHPSPGVTVAALSLPAGDYFVTAKFRYELTGSVAENAGCVFQGVGTGGSEGSGGQPEPILFSVQGTFGNQVDGVLMDIVTKSVGDPPDVHVQCFGPPDVSIVNARFQAVSAGMLTVQ
jgi:hypothetical protein